MALSCRMKCLKMTLFVFNFIFWVCGIAVLGIGIWSRVDSKDWDSLLGDDNTVLNAANIMIAAGIFVMIIGFLGCCGAVKESKVLLILYAILLILIFIMEIAAGIYAYTKKDDVLKSFETSIDKAISTSYGEGSKADEALTKAVDWFQKNVECCGAKGPDDWATSEWNKTKTSSNKVPDSCCKDDKKPCTSYSKGCVGASKDFVKDHMWQIGGVGVGIAFVQLFGIVSAILLCRALGEHDKF